MFERFVLVLALYSYCEEEKYCKSLVSKIERPWE